MIFHIYADEKNVGDLVSAMGIQKSLGKRKIKKFVFREWMETYGDNWHAEMCDEIRKTAEPNDLIIIGGGGLFHGCFEPFWKEFLKRDYEAKSYLWGVGNCEIKDELTLLPREIIEGILKKIKVLSVRDQRTASWLGYHRRIRVVGCPSFNYFGMKYNWNRTAPNEKYRLLYVKHEGLEKEFEKEITRRIEKIASDNNYELEKHDNSISNVIHKDTLLATYRWADLIVTSRLHGCIIGHAFGKKILSISNDHKIDEFMLSIDSLDFVFTPRNFLNSIYSFDSIFNQRVDMKYRLKTITQNKKIALEINFRYSCLHLQKNYFRLKSIILSDLR